MHFHYYTLGHLSRVLNQQMQGAELLACFSQNKNELVLDFSDWCLRVGCHTPLTYVIPVMEFARARRNVVELFPDLPGHKFLQASVVPYERVMVLTFEGDRQLVLKMYGIGANILLMQEGEVTDLFNRQLEEDWKFKPEAGVHDEAGFEAQPVAKRSEVLKALRRISPIYEKHFAAAVVHQMEQGHSFASAARAVIEEARSPTFYIQKTDTRMQFLLFAPPDRENTARIEGVNEALGFFLRTHYQYTHYRLQYRQLEKAYGKPYQKLQKVHDSYVRSVQQIEGERNPEEIGHLIMANLHQLPLGSKKAELEDFYTGTTITLKLDPTLNAQDNAQRYYAKHKQRKAKVAYLKEQICDIAEKLAAAAQAWEAFEAITAPEALHFSQQGFDMEDLKAMKQLRKGVEKEQEAEEREKYPFRTFEKEGYQIFVGKNGRNNDELSFHFANKDDLWLHVKDVAGSHVIVRQRPGKPIPSTVLEYAASLAAYYSKKKNDTLVPVAYTPRKYVRKRKGDAPGQVVIMRSDTIMVEPIRD